MTLFCRFFTCLWEFLLSKTLYLSSWDCVKWSLSLKLSKGKGFCLFYWPFIVHSCFTSFIFAARTLDFAVKFRLVFRHEAVVFRRYVFALLSVGLLRKFEAYLVYLSLNWTKNPRRFSFFQKFLHFTYMLLWFSRANWWHAQSFFSSVDGSTCCADMRNILYMCKITSGQPSSRSAVQAF